MSAPGEERLFIDASVNTAQSCGYYVRSDLKEIIQRIEAQGHKVIGIVYNDTYTLELLLDPPLGGEEE